jgi:uncharacterized protein (TIGR02001 family)
MMRFSLAPPSACVIALMFWATLAGQSVLAQSPARFGGNIGITNDYVYRGISQTAGEAALQGDVHYRFRGGWTVGAWASHADLSGENEAPSEIDLYVSRDWTLDDDWDLRITATHYTFPNDPRQSSYDYEELITSLSYKARLFTTVTWTPNLTRYSNNGFVRNETATSYEVAAIQPLLAQVSGSLGVGYYDLPGVLRADYWFWNVGLAYSLGRAQLMLAYIDTDSTATQAFGYEVTGNRWAGSVAWKF